MDPVILYYLGIGAGLLAGWIWLSGHRKQRGRVK
jgi:hypothetical protein